MFLSQSWSSSPRKIPTKVLFTMASANRPSSTAKICWLCTLNYVFPSLMLLNTRFAIYTGHDLRNFACFLRSCSSIVQVFSSGKSDVRCCREVAGVNAGFIATATTTSHNQLSKGSKIGHWLRDWEAGAARKDASKPSVTSLKLSLSEQLVYMEYGTVDPRLWWGLSEQFLPRFDSR